MAEQTAPAAKWGPAWFYGPRGEAQVFQAQADVPEGWLDAPGKHGTNLDQDAPPPPEPLALTRGQIIIELKSRGAPVDVKLTSRVLYDQLVELIDRET